MILTHAIRPLNLANVRLIYVLEFDTLPLRAHDLFGRAIIPIPAVVSLRILVFLVDRFQFCMSAELIVSH